ncbi:DUF6891 domain-containing protein [Pyxidicoccus sp. MSG2]|uniref:DUF6891 domain-containing protein n=1 Tax=Pyxidicoccus sp. MSG2 TaxID=2996790 RepID=UPI0022703681|nr:hypothetical protein [Pyxidicoccus sp. MSG2]MCY1018577.1 hypothetical protein [Pyxidicoccus sp. MSG2]
MSDDDSRKHLFARVECAVRGGFEDEEELLESLEQWVEDELGESSGVLTEQLQDHARKLLQEQRVREAGWSEPTLNDAIDSAFDELNQRGIVALENAGYTMSDGWSDVNEVASYQDTPPRGAVFYHGQDLERGVAGQGLMLAFGAYENNSAKHAAASLAIGREVCEVLGRHGVKTEWNGSVEERIQIPPFEWRKRRWSELARA